MLNTMEQTRLNICILSNQKTYLFIYLLNVKFDFIVVFVLFTKSSLPWVTPLIGESYHFLHLWLTEGLEHFHRREEEE